jgi:hypothetical protein
MIQIGVCMNAPNQLGEEGGGLGPSDGALLESEESPVEELARGGNEVGLGPAMLSAISSSVRSWSAMAVAFPGQKFMITNSLNGHIAKREIAARPSCQAPDQW